MFEYTILTKIRSKERIELLDKAECQVYFREELPISAASIAGFVIRNKQEIIVRGIIRREVKEDV